jgi:hypothetical protein
MVTIENLLNILPVASLVVIGTYYSLQIRTQNKTRQAQLFMQLYDRFTSTRFHRQGNAIRFQWEWSDFDDFIEKYGPENNLEAWADMLTVFTVFEGMGLLVKKKLVDVNMVDELMLGLITRTWESFENLIPEYRERFNWPQAGRSFEYLYNEMKRREKLSQAL